MPPHGRRSGFDWMDARVTSGTSPNSGRGCFATEPIPAGATVFALGGRVMEIAKEAGDLGVQISEEYILGSLPDEQSGADFVNHSCEPNLGFLGQVFLITLRDVVPGEELCFDYAMCLGGDIAYSMQCRCGSPNCRGTITQLDWQDQVLQTKYAGHIQWYLENIVQRNISHHNLAVSP